MTGGIVYQSIGVGITIKGLCERGKNVILIRLLKGVEIQDQGKRAIKVEVR